MEIMLQKPVITEFSILRMTPLDPCHRRRNEVLIAHGYISIVRGIVSICHHFRTSLQSHCFYEMQILAVFCRSTMKVMVKMPHMHLCVMSYCGMTHWTPKFVNWDVLALVYMGYFDYLFYTQVV